MPARHEIDDNARLIVTTWSGVATDEELINALLKYQEEIRSRSPYGAYDEILDLSQTAEFELSAGAIRKLAVIAARTDVLGAGSRLAIIVRKPLAYGLGRMYETYRSLLPETSKEVRVFRDHDKALEWIANKV